MSELKAIYLVVTGASSARCVPDLIKALTEFNLPIYTLLSESAHQIISPYNLADIPDHQLVSSYFNPALLNGRQPGLTLVVPATFNTLSKMAQGIADNLPLSLVAEAIGAGWPVMVVPGMNQNLANHPQMAKSIKTLREWGVTVMESHLERELLMMASLEEIIVAVRTVLQGD
jgi:phosphopantothenoylcysteine decarboxylase/phosphopantothenate--cysteine ligase